MPPLRRVLRCAVTGRFLKLMTLPFRGRWAGRKAGSDEVGPPAVTPVCTLPHRRTTSSVFRQKRKRFHRNPPSPEPQASPAGEGFWRPHHLDKSEYTAFHLSVAATIRRHRCFLDTGGGRLPPLHVRNGCISILVCRVWTQGDDLREWRWAGGASARYACLP